MADRVPLILREDNDEVLELTITPEDPTEDLTGVASLTLILKDDDCTADTALGVLTLTSADPAQVDITDRTSATITAIAYIPRTALVGSYDRFWRVDGYATGGAKRTSMYGPVTVVPL